MKKWIKKITIASAGLGLVASGAGIVNQINSKATSSNLNDRKPNFWHTLNYGLNDRKYVLTLTETDTANLNKYITTSKTTYVQGIYLYNFITTGPKLSPGWEFGHAVWNIMDIRNDKYSFKDLFTMRNSHTYKDGFNLPNFLKTLKQYTERKVAMTIKLYVQYEFLGHNNYAADYAQQ